MPVLGAFDILSARVDRRRRRRTSPIEDVPEQIDTRVEARTEDLVGANLGLSELSASLDLLSPSLRSLTTTCQPSFFNNRAAATPDSPRPMT